MSKRKKRLLSASPLRVIKKKKNGKMGGGRETPPKPPPNFEAYYAKERNPVNNAVRGDPLYLFLRRRTGK